MTETAHADAPGRHGVDHVLFWIERDRPGVYCRWFLDNESTIYIPPGQPLDLRLSCATFKEMMAEHLSLQKSVSADVTHYLKAFGRNLVKYGGPLAILAVVLTNFYFIQHHHNEEFHQDKPLMALHAPVQPGCKKPAEPPAREHAGLVFP